MRAVTRSVLVIPALEASLVGGTSYDSEARDSDATATKWKEQRLGRGCRLPVLV